MTLPSPLIFSPADRGGSGWTISYKSSLNYKAVLAHSAPTAPQAWGEALVAKANRYDIMFPLLEEVWNACLFEEDNNEIGVTEEPHISSDLFSRISAALKGAPSQPAPQAPPEAGKVRS